MTSDAARTRPGARYQIAAGLRAEGLTTREIAARMRLPPARVSALLCYAHQKGVAPPPRTRRDAGGVGTFMYYLGKGAAPSLGNVARVLADLPAEHVERLLALVRPGDRTLADTLGRIVREYLDGIAADTH